MKLWKKAIFLVTAALVSFSSQVWATPINLNPNNTSPKNAGDGTVQAWLTGLINSYDAANHATFSTSNVGATPNIKLNAGDAAQGSFTSLATDTLNITLPANLDSYLVLHWGGPGGGVFQAFDLAAVPEGSDTFNAPGKYGLSSYAFYGPNSPSAPAPVPEPGTIVLLGAGFLGIAVYGKRRQNA